MYSRRVMGSLLSLLIVVFLFTFNISGVEAAGIVYASKETTPVLSTNDAADDTAIWIHPTDPTLSTIIGTDKPGHLEVYDLNGQVLQRIAFKSNNVDLRYNFPFNGERITLVTGID